MALTATTTQDDLISRTTAGRPVTERSRFMAARQQQSIGFQQPPTESVAHQRVFGQVYLSWLKRVTMFVATLLLLLTGSLAQLAQPGSFLLSVATARAAGATHGDQSTPSRSILERLPSLRTNHSSPPLLQVPPHTLLLQPLQLPNPSRFVIRQICQWLPLLSPCMLVRLLRLSAAMANWR